MSLVCWEGRLNIKLVTLKLLVMEFINGILSASRSILVITSSIKADKGERLLIPFSVGLGIHKDGLDLTISREVAFDGFFSPVGVEVFNVDIVR